MPACVAFIGAFFAASNYVLAPLGVVMGRMGLSWWRSMNLALAKGSKLGLRVGLDNASRNVGTAFCAGVLSLCEQCMMTVEASAIIVFAFAISAAGFSSRLRRWRSHHL